MRLSWQLTAPPVKISPMAHTDLVSDANELTIAVDPAEAGLDKDRLKRIDAHFARYVEDGRLAGWLLTIGRHGRLAHVARCGSRDLEAGLPVTDATVWRLYSMTKPVRVWHLLTHTAGLTYGFHRVHPVDALYRAAGFEWGTPPGVDLAQACDIWAGLPLVFQPGTEWNYGVSTDVL